MFTIFHLLVLVGFVYGAIFGAHAGSALCGTVGGVVGAIAGCIVGVCVGRIPGFLTLLWLARGLRSKSTSELKSDLRSESCVTPNCVLLELQRRGENIRPELPVVLDMLISENVGRRGLGWAALTSAFPDLAKQIQDYRIQDSVDDCRKKTNILHWHPIAGKIRP